MLTELDFLRAAGRLNAPVPRIKAVCEVEAPNGGFDAQGTPRILFEAHVFSRLTDGMYDRTDPDISSPTWNQSLYGKGPNADARNAVEHRRLAKATRLNRPAALMSASWGLFQILGENYAQCGFATLQEFINAAYKDEGAHLDMFMEFVRADKRKHPTTGLTMLEALQIGDWASFARLYNGKSYAKNKYDIRLAAAEKKHQ
jgi:hypothetical protein